MVHQYFLAKDAVHEEGSASLGLESYHSWCFQCRRYKVSPVISFPCGKLMSVQPRIWGVYYDKLYDLTDYVYTLGLNQNSGTFTFLDSDFLSVFRQRSGQDITQPLNSILNSMNSTYRAEHLACIENVFLAGRTDFRKTPRCQVQNYMLIVISGILMASIALKCACRFKFVV